MSDLTGQTFASIFPKLVQTPDGNTLEQSDGTGVTTPHVSGISFDGGTNVLSDFTSKKTWTPVADSTVGDVDWDITVNQAWYRVIDGIMECFCRFTIDVITTQGTGAFGIDGVPLVYSNDLLGTVLTEGVNYNINTLQVVPRQLFGNRIRLVQMRDDNSALNVNPGQFSVGDKVLLHFTAEL